MQLAEAVAAVLVAEPAAAVPVAVERRAAVPVAAMPVVKPVAETLAGPFAGPIAVPAAEPVAIEQLRIERPVAGDSADTLGGHGDLNSQAPAIRRGWHLGQSTRSPCGANLIYPEHENSTNKIHFLVKMHVSSDGRRVDSVFFDEFSEIIKKPMLFVRKVVKYTYIYIYIYTVFS